MGNNGTDTDTATGPGVHVDAGVLGELHLTLGGLKNRLDSDAAERDEAKAKRDARRRLMPTDAPVFGSGIVGSDGTLTLDLGAPVVGRVWELKSLAVGGALVTDTPTGTAYLVRSASLLPSAVPLVTMVDRTNAALPQMSFYSTRQIVFQNGEHLYVIIGGGESTDQIVVAGKVTDYPLDAYAVAAVI